MMKKLVLIFALVGLLASLPTLAGDTFTGKVKWITDGDTIVVGVGNRHVVVQLAGIDAPELTQEYGKDARDFLSNLAKKQKVTVDVLERKANHSVVANVSIGDKDLATAMVEAGFAWAENEQAVETLKAAEKKAQSSKEGLWVVSNPTPPWRYRSGA